MENRRHSASRLFGIPGNRAFASASESIIRSRPSGGRPARPNSISRKPKSNGALCAISLLSAKNSTERLGDLSEQRLSRQVAVGEAVNTRGFGRDVALRIDQRMKVPAGGQVVDQLQRRDLDDAVAVQRVEAGRFRVEQ